MQNQICETIALRAGWTLVTRRLRDPWSVPRLAQAFGISSRTLHRVFLREYGTSPMLLLRRARLGAARAQLQAAAPGQTVTTVALDCGFAHLGRFSQDYVRQFGESPSETLRRARRRHRPAQLATPPSAAPSYAAQPSVLGLV